MTKKHFIALADALRNVVPADQESSDYRRGVRDAIEAVSDVCKQSNPRFNRERWMAYIAGICGPNGGAK
jgi:hypothetical protein